MTTYDEYMIRSQVLQEELTESNSKLRYHMEMMGKLGMLYSKTFLGGYVGFTLAKGTLRGSTTRSYVRVARVDAKCDGIHVGDSAEIKFTFRYSATSYFLTVASCVLEVVIILVETKKILENFWIFFFYSIFLIFLVFWFSEFSFSLNFFFK